jgi:hypothetical protein
LDAPELSLVAALAGQQLPAPPGDPAAGVHVAQHMFNDISLTQSLPEGYRHCFMEYERRSTTTRRV